MLQLQNHALLKSYRQGSNDIQSLFSTHAWLANSYRTLFQLTA